MSVPITSSAFTDREKKVQILHAVLRELSQILTLLLFLFGQKSVLVSCVVQWVCTASKHVLAVISQGISPESINKKY